MKWGNKLGSKSRQAGSALLIAVFALLLISVVGLALLLSTGTDSALAGNYRTSTSAYYAALAGLEEARGRLLWRNPNYLGDATLSFVSSNIHNVVYILNPASGETVNPLDLIGSYGDSEYNGEFPSWSLTGANVQTVASVFSSGGPLPGPLYKWVRINALSEQALNLDVDGGGINPDPTAKLNFTGSGLTSNPSAAPAALEVTGLAIMPDKSRKLLQYIVVPNSFQYLFAPNSAVPSPAFPAALTLAGNGVSYVGPTSSAWNINGNDPTTGRTCATPPASGYAIGFTNPADQGTVVSGTSANPNDYTGFAPPSPAAATPSVGVVTLAANLQRPSQVEALIQTISQGADAVLSPTLPATTVLGAALPTGPAGMSPTNPMTIVVNGDLDLTSWHNVGFGLLLVTGKLIYDPDASWEGIVLVAGKGVVTGSGAGVGRFDGAFLVAQSRDPVSGAVLPDPNLGASSVTFPSNMGGYGIYYNSCTIQQALSPTSYRVISFREITQ
jgi:hypothetical protein